MAELTRISVAAAIVRLNATCALLNGGTIKIYDGPSPASVAAVETGVHLATLTLSATAFGSALPGGPGANAFANTIFSGNGLADGIAGWFRAYDSNGVGVIQGRCGATNAAFLMQSLNIITGEVVAATAWVLRESTG